MKFGHQYQESLKDGFPAPWRASAISYRQLKKCIKSVGRELSSLGLDPETLRLLLNSVGERDASTSSTTTGALFQYRLDEDQPSPSSQCERFQPKLIFAVDEETGEPIDACLSKETRLHLQQLARQQGLTNVRATHGSISSNGSASDDDSTNQPFDCAHRSSSVDSRASGRAIREVEVTLTADSEFFNRLTEELSGLQTLQDSQQGKLSNEIKAIGDELKQVVGADNKKSRSDLDQWRRIFELYLDSRIFYSTNEQDHGSNGFLKARNQLQLFNNRLIADEGVLKKFRRKESIPLLARFLQINAELLQNIHFHELNRTALTKILKKFDKRTSLNASTTFPSTIAASPLQKTIAKAICYELHTELLPVIPQIDDYQCAICTSIHWRPVRLRCNHVYCIRCLVILQRKLTTKCPLCREETVMEADEGNIDEEMMVFLKKNFPTEVKIKQKENESAASWEQFGQAYATAVASEDRCTVM